MIENLLEYVIYALLGYSYVVSPRDYAYDGKICQWRVTFENRVDLIFDENDRKVLQFMVETSGDPDAVERISKLLTYFV